MSLKVVNLLPADFFDEAIDASTSSRSRVSAKTYNRKVTAISKTNKIKFEETFESQLDKDEMKDLSEIRQGFLSGERNIKE